VLDGDTLVLENKVRLRLRNIDNNSPYTKRYYYPGCAQYKFVIVEEDQGEEWFCTEKQAQKAGYQKAKSCY
jgi:hypothetical protein